MFGRVRVGVPNVHPARLMSSANVLVLVEAQLQLVPVAEALKRPTQAT